MLPEPEGCQRRGYSITSPTQTRSNGAAACRCTLRTVSASAASYSHTMRIRSVDSTLRFHVTLYTSRQGRSRSATPAKLTDERPREHQVLVLLKRQSRCSSSALRALALEHIRAVRAVNGAASRFLTLHSVRELEVITARVTSMTGTSLVILIDEADFRIFTATRLESVCICPDQSP